MLACAFIIKSQFTNSTLYNVSVTNVMNTFGCSYKKAKTLMEEFQNSELFIFNEKKNCLFAKSFKDKTNKLFGRKANKRYVAQSDACYKMSASEGDTLRKVVKTLRYVLLTNAIIAKERDNSIVTCNSSSVKKPSKYEAMSQRKLGNAIGLSKSSACRYVKELVNSQIVSKSEIVAECAIPELNTETANAFMKANPTQRFSAWHNTKNGHWSGWIVYGCVYSIVSADFAKKFKHVIYNYKFPIVTTPQTSCELDGDAYFRKFDN